MKHSLYILNSLLRGQTMAMVFTIGLLLLSSNVLKAQFSANYSQETIGQILLDLESEFDLDFSYCNNCLPLEGECTVYLRGNDLSEIMALLESNCGISSRNVGGNWVLRFEEQTKDAQLVLNTKQQQAKVEKETALASVSNSDVVLDDIPVEEKPRVQQAVLPLNSKNIEPNVFLPQEKNNVELPAKRVSTFPPLERKSAFITIPEFVYKVIDFTDERVDELREQLKKDDKDKTSKTSKNLKTDSDDQLAENSASDKIDSDGSSEKSSSEIKEAIKSKRGSDNSNSNTDADAEEERGKEIAAVEDKTEEQKSEQEKEEELKDRNRGSKIERQNKAQVSLLPFIGSNGRKSNTTESEYSLNVLWGTTGSVKGAELGGLVNNVKEDMHGVQVGGLFNKVGKSTKGLQIAGLGNIAKGELQAVQVGGLFNLAEEVDGLQVGGLFNHASGSQTESWQVAGLANYSEGKTHTQVAGILNHAENVEGVQVSGIVNIADTVQGLQIGLVNIANDVSGASIGLLSFVKNGHNKITIYNEEVFDYNLKISMGSRAFYNILIAGTNDFEREYTFGYGIGHNINLKNKWSLGIETVGSYVVEDPPLDLAFYSMKWRATFSLLLNYEIAKKLAITAGPSLDFRYLELEGNGNLILLPDAPVEISNSDPLIHLWFGWQVGIQLL